MTLIEIMIVVAVTALMIGMLVFGVGAGRSAEVTRSINQIGNTLRYGYDKARVNGGYYRMHIDLEKGTFTLQEGDGRMYLPATDRDGRILEFDEAEAEEQADRDRRAAESYNRSLQSQVFEAGGSGGELDPYKPMAREVPRRKPPLFEAFEEDNSMSGLVKPLTLPEGLKVVYVRTADDLEPITEGEASVFYFPRGRTQKAHIIIEDTEVEDSVWTIKIEPLTGRVTIEDGREELELPEDRDDEEDDLGQDRDRRTF